MFTIIWLRPRGRYTRVVSSYHSFLLCSFFSSYYGQNVCYTFTSEITDYYFINDSNCLHLTNNTVGTKRLSDQFPPALLKT